MAAILVARPAGWLAEFHLMSDSGFAVLPSSTQRNHAGLPIDLYKSKVEIDQRFAEAVAIVGDPVGFVS